MEDKIKYLIDAVRKGNTIESKIFFKDLFNSNNNSRAIQEAVYKKLLKLSVESGFLAIHHSFLLQEDMKEKKMLKKWMYNICGFVSQFENKYLFVPRFLQMYSSIVLPIDSYGCDNKIFCRNDHIKCEIVSYFRSSNKSKNNCILFLAFSIIELLFYQHNVANEILILCDFFRFCFFLLCSNSIQDLWKIFEIYLVHSNYYDRTSPNNTFFKFFKFMNEQSLFLSKFSTLHLNFVVLFGYCVIFNIPFQNKLAEIDKDALKGVDTTSISILKNTKKVKPQKDQDSFKALEEHFAKKFGHYSPLFKEKMNQLSSTTKINEISDSYYDNLKRAYTFFHASDDNFTIQSYLIEKSRRIIAEQSNNIHSFQINMIDLFIINASQQIEFFKNIKLIENDWLIPWVYTSTGKMICGSFLKSESEYLCRWQYFLKLCDAFVELQFTIYSLPFERFYTIHDFALENPICALKDYKKSYDSYITACVICYFLGMYIVGYPSAFYSSDLVLDKNGRMMFAGIFRKCNIDEESSRLSSVKSLKNFTSIKKEEILKFSNDFKKEMKNETYSIFTNDSYLKKVCKFSEWEKLICAFENEFL